MEHAATEDAVQTRNKERFAVQRCSCMGNQERICAGESKAEPTYAVLPGQTKQFESPDSVCT